MKTKEEVLAAYNTVVTHPEAEANPYLEGMEAALSWVLTDTMRDILDGFIVIQIIQVRWKNRMTVTKQ
jgi:hypothetical protein